MYTADSHGRVWLDEDSFLAPFGHFQKDYDFVINYLRDSSVASKTYFDGFDENLLLQLYGAYLQQGHGWIGFHKKERASFHILETASFVPLVYVVHGGISKKLWGKGSDLCANFIKWFVFEEKDGIKLEGNIFKPNPALVAYYKRNGMTKDCEIKNRVSVDGKIHSLVIYSMSKEDYLGKPKEEVKEKKKKKRKSKKKKRS